MRMRSMMKIQCVRRQKSFWTILTNVVVLTFADKNKLNKQNNTKNTNEKSNHITITIMTQYSAGCRLQEIQKVTSTANVPENFHNTSDTTELCYRPTCNVTKLCKMVNIWRRYYQVKPIFCNETRKQFLYSKQVNYNYLCEILNVLPDPQLNCNFLYNQPQHKQIWNIITQENHFCHVSFSTARTYQALQ